MPALQNAETALNTDIHIPFKPYSGINTVIYNNAPEPSTINVPASTFLRNLTIPDKELRLNAS